ncbi:hypothetical protein R3P38DRAFT_2786802 [Favolaschia claudopus]|uniref:Uncharacterized protein n=1 Tax=Favolaschia claudopus TaxID=2862362 RepID=A0AAW0AQK9_9AGAR
MEQVMTSRFVKGPTGVTHQGGCKPAAETDVYVRRAEDQRSAKTGNLPKTKPETGDKLLLAPAFEDKAVDTLFAGSERDKEGLGFAGQGKGGWHGGTNKLVIRNGSVLSRARSHPSPVCIWRAVAAPSDATPKNRTAYFWNF